MKLQTHTLRQPTRRTDGVRHRGVVLVATLVCLLIVMMMLGAMLRGAMRAHRQQRNERDFQQTELLLQAASDRAAFRLANEAKYRGETWELPGNAIVGTDAGRITIDASRVNGQPIWEVKVLAEYPLGRETSIRRSRTFQVPIQVSRQ